MSFREGGADGSRKLRLAKKARGEAFLARLMVISGYIFIGLSILTTLIACLDAQWEKDMTENGVQTKGLINNVEIDMTPILKGRMASKYFSVSTTASYRSHDGVEHEISHKEDYPGDRISEINPDHKVGDTIIVLYNPDDPSDYLMKEWDSNSDLIFIPLTLVLGVVNIHFGRNYKIYRTMGP